MGWFCFCQDPKHTKTIGYTWYKDQFHYIFMCEEEFSCIFPHTSSKIVYWHIDVAVGPECETLPSCPIRGYSIPTWFQSFWIYCRGSAMRCEIFNRDQQSPPQDLHAHGITSPLGHLIHDSDPGLCSQSFWFKIASWPWKFAPLSPLSDSFAMRAVWTVLFFVVAVALRPECLCQITPQRKRCCNLCVYNVRSRLQIALNIINQGNIHGP